jgi:hypothetical protein
MLGVGNVSTITEQAGYENFGWLYLVPTIHLTVENQSERSADNVFLCHRRKSVAGDWFFEICDAKREKAVTTSSNSPLAKIFLTPKQRSEHRGLVIWLTPPGRSLPAMKGTLKAV